MNVGKSKNRMFGAIVLLLMAVLAVCTMVVFATEGQENSYSLVIRKIFADGTPEAAKDLTYKFKIQGTVLVNGDGGDKVEEPIDEIVEINKDNNWTYTYKYSKDGPITATVTEITSGIQLSVNGVDYNMGNSVCETEALLKGPEPQVLQLKNNARITISRPAETAQTTTWFKISKAPYPGHEAGTSDPWGPEIIELVPGGAAHEFENLPAGIYTIEELKAPDGYSIEVGPRTEFVSADPNGNAVGDFYINGDPGKLTITAGGQAGDGATHYYTIDRVPEEKDDGFPRTVRVDSAEQYTFADLPKGKYTVTELTYGGKSGYTLTVPQSDSVTRTNKKSSALSFNGNRSWKSLTLGEDVDYVSIIKFGPLYDKSGNRMTETDTYSNVYYGIVDDNNSVIRKGGFANSTPFKGNAIYSANNPPEITLNANKKLSFSVINVSNTEAGTIGIQWIEYSEKQPVEDTITKKFGSVTSKTVDRRGWMIFSKDADSEQGAENLTYYYTITSGDKKSVANCTATDTDGNALSGALEMVNASTVKLAVKPGQTVKLNGLEKGTYSIVETVNEDKADGFTMEVVGCPVSITEANVTQEITVYGKRTITINKPKCLTENGDGGRDYTFAIKQGVNELGRVTVKAGGSATYTLPGADYYEVYPTNEAPEPFQMTYTDSSSVTGMAAGSPSATITFKNVFTEGDGSYRYIHEYYLKQSDGSYIHEGSSGITHVRGLELDEYFQALDIVEEPMFTPKGSGASYQYTHFSDGYGLVDVGQGQAANVEPEIPTEGDPTDVPPADTDQPGADDSTNTPPADTDQPGTDDSTDTPPADTDQPGTDDSTDTPPVDTDQPGTDDSTDTPPVDTDQPGTDDSTDIPPAADKGEDGTEKPDAQPGEAQDLTDEAVPFASSPRLAGSNGVLTEGEGLEVSDSNKTLTYRVDSGMKRANVTEDGSNIIILRYYREVPETSKGSYKVIHVYYFRDSEGSHWEGSSEVDTLDGQLGHSYTAAGIPLVERPTNFDVDGKHYTYTYGKNPQYGLLEKDNSGGGGTGDGYIDGYVYRPNTNWTSVEATENGSQIIILRYYREVSGSYNIVHEYYFREKEEDVDVDKGEETPGEDGDNVPETGSVGENETETAAYAASENGTLVISDGYSYTFEGKTEIESFAAQLGSNHEGERSDWKLSFGNNNYTYLNVGYGEKDGSGYKCIPDKQWATATEDGNQVIILRYFRGDGTPTEPENPPTDPENPPTDPEDPPTDPEDPPTDPEDPPTDPEDPPTDPEDPPTDPEDPPTDPEDPPTDPEDPPTDPEDPPTDPEYPTELPDPNDPDSPDEITIWEDGVPKTYIKMWDPENEEYVYVLDSEVPLWGLTPKTDDTSKTALWAALSLGSLGTLGVLYFLQPYGRKRDEA